MFLRLFGPPPLLESSEAGATVLLPPGKPAALLAYLSCVPALRASRDELLDLLWSHVEPERGRQSLRQALTHLRHVLGPGGIEGARDVVGLRTALFSDVAAFDGALADGRPAEALHWSAAPFLSDFAVPGGATFERWASAARVRYDHAVARAHEMVVRDHLDAGRFREACSVARLALSVAMDREPAWRQLLEALLSADDRLTASLEAAALERWLADEEHEPEPATRRLLRRARSEWNDRPARRSGDLTDAAAAPLLAPELVGREREFARLLDAWNEARGGGFVRMHVTGGPGVGKSRLITEVVQRWRAAGVTALLVRCYPGSRRIPGVLLADVVSALARLPGALAVSPTSADAIVELAPALADTYRGATSGSGRSAADLLGAEVERRRLQALEQLVRAVAEERPVGLILDDVHWADDVSSRVVLGCLERLVSCRLLLVTAARDGTAPAWALSDRGREPATRAVSGDHTMRARTMALAPLSDGAVDALVRSIGALPAAKWPDVLVPSLAAAARGVPLVVLELLALLVERRLLVLTADGWRLGDASAPLESSCALLEASAGPGARVTSLELDGLHILTALAVAGAPLPTSAVAAGVSCGADVAELRLAALAQRGLVSLTDAGMWETAHDEIRAAVLARLDGDALRTIARSLGAHFAAIATGAADEASTLARSAVAFALAGHDAALVGVFCRWLVLRRRHGDRRSDAELAHELLGESASPRRVRVLLDGRPLVERWGTGLRRALAAVLAVTLVGATGAGVGQLAGARSAEAQARRARRPARLTLVTQPVAWQIGFPMTPVPIVEVQDERGEAVTTARDSVRLEAIGDVAIVSSGTVPVVHGRATFDHAVLVQRSSDALSARFTYPGVPPLVAPLTSIGTLYSAVRLHLVQGSVNGQVVSPEQRTASVRPGDSIAVVLDLRYTSPWPAANVVMGAAPSWGDPAKSFVRLASLVTPARDFALHARAALKAPSEAGRYHIVIAFGAEENVTYLLSGTNWTVGRAIWHDGNDVADWSLAQRDEANRTGSAPTVMLERQGGPVTTGIATAASPAAVRRVPVRVPATTLTIDVLPRR